MPPKKEKPAPIPSSLDMTTLSSLLAAFTKLCDMHNELMKKHDALLDRVVKLEEANTRLLALNRAQMPSQADVSRIVTRAIADQDLHREKNLRAVIEKSPESDTDESTHDRDIHQIQKICSQIGVAADLVPEEIHRHGRCKAGSIRIIKVPFKSSAARDTFIRHFNKFRRQCFPSAARPVTCRRDLTPLELQTHYAKKKECFEMNQAEGCFKYYYRDLEIYENRSPRPFQSK